MEESNPLRIEEYRNKVLEVRDMQAKLIPGFGKDVLKEKFRAAKADVNRMRTQLLADVNEQTEFMMKSLMEVKSPTLGATLVGLAASSQGIGPFSAVSGLANEKSNEILSPEQKSLSLVSETQTASSQALMPLKKLDLLISYGTLVIGACLLLGLFSRLASLGGVMFLLLLYLAMPPFPWLPDPPRALEGHYLFVSKNLIEMIALLALATTRSGRWAGLDGLIGLGVDSFRKHLRGSQGRSLDNGAMESDEPSELHRHASRAEVPVASGNPNWRE
jgi:uncharacterized membrane protein YphA (DoxX/SURF4 family)